MRDFWDSDRPAIALSNRSRDDGVYEEVLFKERLFSIVSRTIIAGGLGCILPRVP
eukprot:COSAG04_NODE_29788_length_266_cov_1.437126_1_plen_54_part_01